MVPIEPYRTLYLPKLFTKTENPKEERMLKNVVVIVPGEISFHLFSTEGAYLKINPIAKKISNIMKIHLVFEMIFLHTGFATSNFNNAP